MSCYVKTKNGRWTNVQRLVHGKYGLFYFTLIKAWFGMTNTFLLCKLYHICRNSGQYFLKADILVDFLHIFKKIIIFNSLIFDCFVAKIHRKCPFILPWCWPGNIQKLEIFQIFLEGRTYIGGKWQRRIWCEKKNKRIQSQSVYVTHSKKHI